MKALILLMGIHVFLYASDLIEPIPLELDYDKPKALLGKKLFHDKRLSRDNTISCESCHRLEEGGDDNLQYSFGVDGQVGTINSPTVFNAHYNFVQFWDGRAKDLKAQARHPIENPIEMGISMDIVLKKLQQDVGYRSQFKALYDDGLTKDNILDAIVEFEKALITPNARFDQYLRGDKTALTQEEREGFELFKENGCISCHNGVNIGGNLYQKVGIMKTYIDDQNIQGRYSITKNEKDKYFFKVPTLRNIALTEPYLHDGSQKSLEEVVKFMLRYQLGMPSEKDEIKKITAFLRTLTGENPKIMDMQ